MNVEQLISGGVVFGLIYWGWTMQSAVRPKWPPGSVGPDQEDHDTRRMGKVIIAIGLVLAWLVVH